MFQPFRWQGRIYLGDGLYDFRARIWSTDLGAFLQPDEYAFLSRGGTLWSWPGQNPFRWRDPSGRLPPGLTAEEEEVLTDADTNARALVFLRNSAFSNWAAGNYGTAALDFAAGVSVSFYGLINTTTAGQLAAALVGGRGARCKGPSLGRAQGGRTHGHHSDPKFMCGKDNQSLTGLPESIHKQLHKDMNDFLSQRQDTMGDHMRPQRGNSGARIRGNFTRQERLEALRDFYRQNASKYPQAARDFFKQHPNL
jgi:RHS repeat-associated protein